MPTFRISYTTEDWWYLDVEAENEDDALNRFHSGEYDRTNAVLTEVDHLQDSVDIEELE